jgi:hypothetical protein
MFSARAAALRQRQQELLLRSAELRVGLAWRSQGLARSLGWIDTLRGGTHALIDWSAAHPLWMAAGIAALVIARPRRAWRWLRRGWWGWRVMRRASAFARLLLGAQGTR